MPAAWVGAAATIGGALLSSNAASNAADAQAASSADAIAEQKRQYDLTRGDYAPYRAAGVTALGQLQTDINKPITAADVMSDPGYQFGLDQGQTALDRKIAAMGGRVSGAALKGATRYATDYASTGYSSAYQRSQDRLNRLAAIAGIGQTATTGSAAAGAQSSNAISNLIASTGDVNAASNLAQANIWGSAGNQIGALANKYYTPNTNFSSGYTAGGSAGSNAPDDIDAGGGWNPSDVRLKRNVRAVGMSPRGFTVYEWNWRNGGAPDRGVIAQEVAWRDPSAVRTGANGFLEVDYSKV